MQRLNAPAAYDRTSGSDRLHTLVALNRVISSSLDMSEVLTAITRAAAEIMQVPFVSLWTVAEPQRTLTPAAASDPHFWADYPLRTLPLEGGGVVGEVARTRQPVNVPDVFADDRILAPEWFQAHGLWSYYGVPIVFQESLLGVLNLNGTAPLRLTSGDHELLASFAAQAAIAIRNAKLFATSERRRRAAEALADVGRALAQSLDPEVVGRRIVESVCRLLGAHSPVLYRLDRGSGDLIAMEVSEEVAAVVGPTVILPPGTGVAGRAVQEGQPVTTLNLLDDPRITLHPDLRARLEKAPYRAILAVPLIVMDEVVGALSVGDGEGRVFDVEDIRLAEAFANQAALALQNAQRLHESKSRQARLEALLEVNRQLSSVQSVDALLRMIVEACARVLESESVGIRLIRDGELVVAGACGGADQVMSTTRLKVGESLSGIVAATGQPLSVRDVADDPRVIPAHRQALARAGYRAWLGVPVTIGDRVIGVLSIRTKRREGFLEADLATATAFASQAAIALENAGLYAGQEVRANRLRTLAGLNRIISSSLDADEVLGRIAQAAADLMEAPLVEFWFADEAARHLELRVFSDAQFGADKKVNSLAFGQAGVGWAAAHRRTLNIPNIFVDERIFAREWWEAHGFTSGLWVPIVLQEELLGVLSLIGRKPFRLGPDQQELLESFIAQAAVAIRNARLFEESEARRQAAEALAEIGRVLSQALEPGEVAQRIVDSVCQLLACQASALYRLEPSSGDLMRVAVSGDVAPLGEQVVFPKGVGVMGLAVRERQAMATPDLLADSRVVLTPEMRGRLEQGGYRAVLAIPLLVQDRVIGALAVGDRSGRRFDHRQVQLAQTFANQAALAFENARLYAEAKHAYEELSRAQTQLVRGETLRAVGELASGASHHLNNLLAVVIGRLQLALKKFNDPELRRQLIPAERAAQDGADVIARLSRFSRRQTAPTVVGVDLNDLAAEVIALTRPRWQNELVAKGITIDVSLERGSIPKVAGDPPSLQEVLVNLILNAVDAMPSGGRITITTWAEDGSVYGRVSDTGIGMSMDVQRRALEPFFTTKGVKSTGLGLSVNYGILQRHGGDIAIESLEGQGTSVTFRLPAHSEVDRPGREALPPARQRPLRILLIDDELEVREIMSDMLIEDGHTVVSATGGAEGLARFLSDPAVDLVLTDLGMPGMTGWEVARAVKASNPSTVVGIVTGWGEEPEARPEERVWADFVLSKPITEESLRSAVARARLRRGTPTPHSAP